MAKWAFFGTATSASTDPDSSKALEMRAPIRNQSTGSRVASMMSNPTTSPAVGTRLGNYELVRLVAQGGMADIYLARQLGIGAFERFVAVKVMNAARAADPDSCALFLDEA